MPGKKEDGSSYTYMYEVAKLRELTEADGEATQAAISAVVESIPLGKNGSGNVSVARGNALIIGVLLPSTVTAATAKVFVDMSGELSVSNKWALVHEEADMDISTHIALQNVYPGECKVLITSVTGNGTIEIVYSKSA